MNQQHALYASEASCGHGRQISPSELQAFVDNLRDSSYWERNHAKVVRILSSVRASDKDGSVGSFVECDACGLIEMAPCHLVEKYVLHEVAHVLAAARYGSTSHDPWFAGIYLELVSLYAPAVYPDLYAAFVRDGIEFDNSSSVPAGIAL